MTPRLLKGGISLCLFLFGLWVGFNGYFALLDKEPNAEQSASVLLAVTPAEIKAPQIDATSTTPQFILLGFDGSKSADVLQDSLTFEKEMSQLGVSVRFTYFINAAYFLTKENATVYQAPHQSPGVTTIGYSNNAQDIAERVALFNQAFLLGNEIGSHTSGHFNGKDWSYDDWSQEFGSFKTLIEGVQRNNPSVTIEAPLFARSIVGFRAPELGVNDELYKVEKSFGFTYDASGVGQPYRWPFKDQLGVWHIPLGTIRIGVHQTPALAMDYSLWMHNSGGKNIALKGTPLWNRYFDEVYKAYTDYFDANYAGNRAPVVIGGHFSLWNDGVYYEALKAFAKAECGKHDVRCTTYKELVNYLNESGVPRAK